VIAGQVLRRMPARERFTTLGLQLLSAKGLAVIATCEVGSRKAVVWIWPRRGQLRIITGGSDAFS